MRGAAIPPWLWARDEQGLFGHLIDGSEFRQCRDGVVDDRIER
jgi:hypothetical protein